ncbi:PREDICTED: uncharacterized protein LOC109237385 isoform X1 [Nicotiana attenuata]|nr:PREDICTED: uncharacterized protein LOC109237385 isoform X1 [Nicotiana attenuata]XP_019259229.1 PREDICTED: uncharacterized protein LOC109237385 isoform X1 [Nicotiana attenuata]XP_019259230.1 PREDICTED: uncharacterized protein LOC109237385 isoform X1 [Nicotiana attenuata]XP_019259231.1 PREDICTED: uncharacterized protein LOC109237385 isoform X1 [Nicotiana attenuata]XP_019259232.1 PREDICTED: uncharacterized protein LOC109237385 isoform X1 [Nicotiana attenuata]XP_019259234.1 PREDICTED: uncharact
MAKEYQLPFKVGQFAEARSFRSGFRSAWFRCKIKEINHKRGHWNARLEYFDYPDEKLTWMRLFQMPPYNIGKSKEKKQLMLRPQYPPIKLKNEVSGVSSISDAMIVVDGNWQVGDLVDWWANGCYWSGQLTKLLGNSKAEMALTPPPIGEGALYEIHFKDLRPSLDWSPNFGWTVLASQYGDSVRRCAQLIQPVNQALGRFPALEIHSMSEGRKDSQAKAGSSSNLSSPTNLYANSLPGSEETKDFKTTGLVEQSSIIDLPKEAANTSKKVSRSDINSGSQLGDKLAKEASWSDNGSTSCIAIDQAKTAETTENFYLSSCPLKKFRTSDGVRLHSMGSDSTEAVILDLEELANKIKWLKGLLEFGKPVSNANRPSWKFVEHHASSRNK